MLSGVREGVMMRVGMVHAWLGDNFMDFDTLTSVIEGSHNVYTNNSKYSSSLLVILSY